MVNRIIEGIIASVAGVLLLGIIGWITGLISFRVDYYVALLAFAIIISLLLHIKSRETLTSLQTKLASVAYSEYYSDEPRAYEKLKESLPTSTRLQVIGLANTNVFSLFDQYKAFLLEKHQIEVLCLDPTSEDSVNNLDRIVTVAAEKYVLPGLLEKVKDLDISETHKTRIAEIIGHSSSSSATKTMIQVSLIAWQALGESADKEELNTSRFLSIRLYHHPPTIKGWILGDHIVLRGNFSIPGYGLTEPVMLFDSKRAPYEVNNFKHAFQLLWTDTQTKSLSGANASVDISIPVVNRFSMLDGCFYETSGITSVERALACVSVQSNSRVLDVASGTGYFSVVLSKMMGDGGKIISVEKNESLVRGFEKRLKSIHKEKDTPEIDVIRSDVHNLRLQPNSFDLVFCRHAIHHFENPSEIIEKIYTWLKPQGIEI